MIGAIIGDVVGSRFEFANHRSTDFDFFHWGCSFTDDSVCTCAVADWVLNYEKSPFMGVGFADVLKSWCIRYPCPMGGYGARFASWINNPVPYDSFGNGAAMRISPVGFAYNSPGEISRVVYQVTSVSHDHPEGIRGAGAVALAILMARRGCSKDEIRDAIIFMYGYSLDFTCDSIRATNVFDETCQVTVPQALVCFLESSDFESAIRLAVSIGGDSDTIAAIAGSVAEAYYGVPSWMIDDVQSFLPVEMRKLVTKFYKTYPNVKKQRSSACGGL